MTLSNTTKQAMTAKLDVLWRDLKVSKEFYLTVDDDYDTVGTELEDRLIDHANRFLDPEEDRAPQIREAARLVVSRVRGFRGTRSHLATKVMLALLSLRQDTLAAAKDVLRAYMDGVGGAELSSVVRQLRVFDTAQTVGTCLVVTSHIITLRKVTLQTFLKHHVDIDLERVIAAIEEAVQDDAWDEALKELFEILGEELDIILRARGIWNRIRENVLKLHNAYSPKGPVDHLFNLATFLDAQDRLFEDCETALQNSVSALAGGSS